jgi:hypothetical protein
MGDSKNAIIVDIGRGIATSAFIVVDVAAGRSSKWVVIHPFFVFLLPPGSKNIVFYF